PDVFSSAKGLQVGACVASKSLFPKEVGAISTTWGGGHILDLSLGVKIIDIIKKEKLLVRNRKIGAYVLRGLEGIDSITNQRGLGLMLAFDLQNAKVRDNVVIESIRRGLIVLGAGDKSIRIIPPYIIHKEEIEEGAKNLYSTLNKIKENKKAKFREILLHFAINNKKLLITLKLIIAAGLIWYLIYKLDYNEIILSLENANYYLIGFVIGLMMLNLYLQYRRWELTSKLLLNQSNNKKIFQSFIYGISAGAFTPARVGEYLGRAMVYKDKPLLHSFGATFLDKFFLLIVVVFTGSIGGVLFLSINYHVSNIIIAPLFIVLFLLLIFFIVVLKNPRYWFDNISVRFKKYKKVNTGIERINSLNFSKTKYANEMLIISILHFITILLQFALLVSAFSFKYNFLGYIWAGSLMLFVKSVIPSISFGDLGVREAAAVFFLLPFGISNVSAFNASIFLFLINILLPAILGLFFLIKRNNV
ncbi:MAG: aminotransferase class III-fold pyridoxal phosphate-dependent enzyme, partial [Bacteroidetes bacterium]|nr:aminotransferase class III-fold pyridoxal phosphate-dependent enzyme [Bacteroidota bacterium]